MHNNPLEAFYRRLKKEIEEDLKSLGIAAKLEHQRHGRTTLYFNSNQDLNLYRLLDKKYRSYGQNILFQPLCLLNSPH